VDRRTWLRASAIDELSRVSIWPEARSDETLGGSGLTTMPRPLCQEEKLKSVADSATANRTVSQILQVRDGA
jgi:hypothetical protein